MEVANEGGSKNGYYRKSIFILQLIVSDNQRSELEYIALGKIAEIQSVYLHDYKSAVITFEKLLQLTQNRNDYDDILFGSSLYRVGNAISKFSRYYTGNPKSSLPAIRVMIAFRYRGLR